MTTARAVLYLSIVRSTPRTDDRFSPDDLDMSRQIYSLPGSLVYGIHNTVAHHVVWWTRIICMIWHMLARLDLYYSTVYADPAQQPLTTAGEDPQ